tara:strand:+ start:998 stop:1249 length:252 start_codon:yes stop_codon:yes gene_type:complete
MDYNGWTNWETWNFMLWINNEERLYNIVLGAAHDFEIHKFFIKFLEKTAAEIVGTELCLDLKSEDIKNINFEEIAEAIKEEVV